MPNTKVQKPVTPITTLSEFAKCVDYSLLNTLNCDPHATQTGDDYQPRQVFSGHFVPVKPTALAAPQYIAHSSILFNELGLDDSLAQTDAFIRLFSGDMSQVPETMKPFGWATGYALSIYGTEYIQQCPFQTGNGYGDGRAISIVEAKLKGKRWEMQLKGAGKTPYCRGADGRAVLRSSVREFLAQEHMHALHIATSRSLSLIVSKSETVDRPWYREGSQSFDPEIMVSNPVAISTRVAPSFLRVGQLELFARRERQSVEDEVYQELEMIVLHLIAREYQDEIDTTLPVKEQVLLLAKAFSERLTSLVVNWMRVGFCQGNFNSDNCAAGGFTLDYGPFGFCEKFDPAFQPWTGGGRHFSFMNQPQAAEKNFEMFCSAIEPLLASERSAEEKLKEIRLEFLSILQQKLAVMWSEKLGLSVFDSDLINEVLNLMISSSADYNMFFRELSNVPEHIAQLSQCFYQPLIPEHETQWSQWLEKWRKLANASENTAALSEKMKRINPKYTWREWLIVPAYEQAMKGDYALVHELQAVLNNPYDEQSKAVENKYYRLRPPEFFNAGGVSHYSCSS